MGVIASIHRRVGRTHEERRRDMHQDQGKKRQSQVVVRNRETDAFDPNRTSISTRDLR
jgi:hypothetical protein